MTELESTWRANRAVVGRRLDDSYVLVNLESQEMFELNASGARIWELLLEGRSLPEIERSLFHEFTGDRTVIHRDLRGLLEALERAGMVRGVAHLEPSSEASPDRTEWMVRWSASAEAPVLCQGRSPFRTADVHEGPSGSWIAVAGYLFDVEDDRRARHVAELRRRLGPEFIHALRGAFAIVAWDGETRSFSVHRDALGVLPIYYVWDGGSFLLSSSIDALLAEPGVDREVHRLHLAEYVYGCAGPHQVGETFFASIRRLPAAHRLSLRHRALRIERWWDPLPKGFEWAGAEELERVEERIDEAVRRCLSAGADSLALSGGFDSVTIALFASMRGGRPLTALSMLMADTENDESPVQRGVAERLGMPQRCFALPGPSERSDFVERALAPSASSPLPVLSMWQWMLVAIIDEAEGGGCSRILMGTGGDEMFNVDPRYASDLIDAGDLAGLLAFLRAWTRTSPFSAQKVAFEILWRSALRPKIARTARSALGDALPMVTSTLRTALGKRRGLEPPASLRVELEGRVVEQPPERDLYVHALRGLVQSPILAMELDQAGAWNARRGVTFLYPFYDRDVVELALRIPPQHLYRSGRMKDPLRSLVARRMPGSRFPKRKVDFTRLGYSLLRESAPRTWRALGGLEHLHRLGVVDLDRVEGWMRDYLSGQRIAPALLWRLLSAESWLRARDGR